RKIRKTLAYADHASESRGGKPADREPALTRPRGRSGRAPAPGELGIGSSSLWVRGSPWLDLFETVASKPNDQGRLQGDNGEATQERHPVTPAISSSMDLHDERHDMDLVRALELAPAFVGSWLRKVRQERHLALLGRLLLLRMRVYVPAAVGTD